MDLRVLLAPLYAAALGGLSVAAFAYGRGHVLRAVPRRLLAWGAFLACALALWASASGAGPAEWISTTSIVRAFGLALLVGAAWLASRASRLRRRADLMAASAPRPIDDAIAELQQGGAPLPGLFQGRLGAEALVTSPGGVACAFYQSEVRQVSEEGGRGRLVSLERACPRLLYLEGGRRRAMLAFDPDAVFALTHVRRCRALQRLSLASEGMAGSGASEVDALSFERVGKPDEPCLVVGRLARGPAPGSYVLTGIRGAPATLVMADSALEPGRMLARRAWALMACAAVLCALSALALARA